MGVFYNLTCPSKLVLFQICDAHPGRERASRLRPPPPPPPPGVQCTLGCGYSLKPMILTHHSCYSVLFSSLSLTGSVGYKKVRNHLFRLYSYGWKPCIANGHISQHSCGLCWVVKNKIGLRGSSGIGHIMAIILPPP